MPLLFNDKPLENDVITGIVSQALPAGRNKMVTFSLINAPIMVRRTEKGEAVMKPGGTKPMSTSQLATINGVEGVLTYYTSKNHVQGKGGTEVNYEPKYVYFRAGEMTFNAEADKPLFALMLKAKYKKENAEHAGVVPLYTMMDTGERAAKKVSHVNEKLEAYDMIREALTKNKPKLRSLYQNLGFSNFSELKAANDWDSILEPIYNACEMTPKKVLELMKSAALDTGAKVTQAIELGILKTDSQGFYWVKGGKKIWAIPAGKGDEGFDLFVNHLRHEDKSGALNQITKELEIAEIGAIAAAP